MVVASKCFAFRALITQAQIWKSFDTFTLFTHSLVGWNLENLWKHAVSIWFRLSWHFKRKNSYFWKASLFQKKNWLRGKLRVQDFATGKNFSFNHCTRQRVFLFSHESYFVKAIENFFSCICIAWYKHSRGWENSRQLCKPSTSSRVCITVSNSPNPSRVYIRLCKHGKRFLLLK